LKINEIFYSIQGEGRNTGIPMVFIRLAGCNLRCSFCDTAYASEGGRKMSGREIVDEVRKYKSKWVCITGGEPFLQDLTSLVNLLKIEGLNIHIESNGTVFQPINPDWLTVSPKTAKEPHPLMLEKANEIKLVVDSQEALNGIEKFERYERAYLSVQPVDNKEDTRSLCIDFVKANPRWHLSVQLHKLLDIK